MLFPLASGSWSNAGLAGVFFRFWYYSRSFDGNDVGFRAADYDAFADLTLHTANTGDIGMTLSCTLAKSACPGFLVPKGKVNHA